MLVKQYDRSVNALPGALNGMEILQALADPIRVEIVRQLAACPGGSELTCGSISLSVTKSTASHHFRTLLDAGVIAERCEGTRKFLHLRRQELDASFPGLIDSVLGATAAR